MLAIIEQQPEWRRRLKKALFPEFDIENSLRQLAETTAALRKMIERMDERLSHVEHDVAVLKEDVAVLKEDVTVLKEDVGVLKQDVGVLKQDVGVLKQDVSILKVDVSNLKGNSQEQKYLNMAAGLFGRYIKNGRDVTNRVADELYTALQAGAISESDITQVLAADLLWGGELRPSKEPIVIVMEASWLAEVHDVERAAHRSEILRRIGITSLAVVGGQEWAADAANLAEQLQVVTTQNGHIDPQSWERAMTQLS